LDAENTHNSSFPAFYFQMNSPAINFDKIWRPFLIAAAVCFLYANVLAKLAVNWWTDDNYSHGLLIPFVVGYIVWLEFDQLKKSVQNPQFLFGGGLVLFALLMLLGGTLGAELFTQRVSLVFMLAGIVVYFWGAKILKMLAVPFILSLLAIPIPQILFNKIAFPLQIYASQMAIWGIRFLEVASVRKGNVIEILPQGSTQVFALEVVEACSGIRSLMTLITLALVLVYFTRSKRATDENDCFDVLRNQDFWRAVILMLSAIPIAVFTNAARVTGTGALTFYYGKKAIESFWHDFSGWLVYLAALIMLISINFLLKFLLSKKYPNSARQLRNPKLNRTRSKKLKKKRKIKKIKTRSRKPQSCSKL
jgi:exosortase